MLVVKSGVFGITGSWGGLLVRPGLEDAEVGCCCCCWVGGALDRRWSRRQYEKTVDGAMVDCNCAQARKQYLQ